MAETLYKQVWDIVYRAVYDEGNDFNAGDATNAIMALPEIMEGQKLRAARNSKVGYERQG